MSGENIEIVKLQIRRGPEAQLPTLDVGEPAITTDTNKFFIGDGTNNHQLANLDDFASVNSQLAQNTSHINSTFINALYPPNGVTAAKGDGVSDDTTALNNLLSYCYTNGFNLFLPNGTYILTNSLVINLYPGIKIEGASRINTTLKMTANNVPIIQSTKQDCHSVEIRGLTLQYTTQQTYASQPNSIAIAFSNPTSNGGGNYYWIVENLRILNATIGIGINQASGTLPLWDMTFRNIIMNGIEHNGINLRSPSPIGTPGNRIENFALINGNGGALVTTDAAIKLSNEAILTNIDIEDWYNVAIDWNTTNGEINGLHLERHNFTGTYTNALYFANQIMRLRNLSITYKATDANLVNINVISSSGCQLSMDNVWLNRQAGTKSVNLITSTSNWSISNYLFNSSGDVLGSNSTLNYATINGKPANSGYGTATIAASGTSVVVNHGLPATPTSITATPQGNVGNVWISNITSAQFTINCSTAPAGATTVSWRAQV